MNDEQLVEQASEAVLQFVSDHGTASPDALDGHAARSNPSLSREIVGLAVLRLLRDGKLGLTDDYEFAEPSKALSAKSA